MEGEVGLHLVVLEVLVQEVVYAHAPQVDAEELGLIVDAPDHQRLRDVVQGDRGRIHQGQEDHVQVALGLLVELAERLGVLLGEAGDGGAGLVEVCVDGKGGAVGEDAAHLDRRAHVAQAVLRELQVVVDGADADQGVVVAVDVVEEAGPRELLRAEAAAFLAPLLEDGDVPAGLGEVGAEGHPVVTRADDYRVVGGVRHIGLLG